MQVSLDRGSKLGRSLTAAGPEPLLHLLHARGRAASTNFQSPASLFGCFQVGQLRLACPFELEHVCEARAVLAPEVGEQLQAPPDRLEAVRILLEPLVSQPELPSHVLNVCLGGSEWHSKLAERLMSRQPRRRHPEQVRGSQAGMGLGGVGSDKSVASFADRGS